MSYISFKNISIRFGVVQALKNVTFDVPKGVVLGLCGENGAGKSTLAKILAGVYPSKMYEGTLAVNGKECAFSNVLEAEKAGVGIVHQELNQFSYMTVAENIFMCSMPNKIGLVEKEKMYEKAQELLDDFDIGVKASQKLDTLSISKRQMVEIVKAISKNCSVIVFDEATSSLTENETKSLFEMIRNLRAKGVTMIYVSHKMNEIFEICDQVVVLKDGEYINSGAVKEVDHDILVKWMTGRELKNMFPEYQEYRGEEKVLEVKNWNVKEKGKEILKDISFDLKKQEIIGFYGLVGAGRTELMESIFCGNEKHSTGELFLHGEKVAIRNVADAIKHGVGMVTEDRRITGLVLSHSVQSNAALASLDEFSDRFKFIKNKELTEQVKKITDYLKLKVPDNNYPVNKLSGGNQQKVVLAKWLLSNPEILILDEPTRGIDVGTKVEIYFMLREMVKANMSIIVVSSELLELMGVCDRIYIMREGTIAGCVLREEFDEEKFVSAAI